ncbi:MAG TPA: hypothetical protein VG269_05090 [Tepidisphaeraceae bacterium]|jgi:hypothetical protein|nr:hypothetical protein [Tepidisphaeraceae bacterium]
MPTATITVPDDIKRLADTRAAAAGYSTVGEYVEALILADAGQPIPPELEAHLLNALQSPAKEVTPGYWDEKRSKLSSGPAPGRQ